jgi:hypothetical protein
VGLQRCIGDAVDASPLRAADLRGQACGSRPGAWAKSVLGRAPPSPSHPALFPHST